MTPVRELRVSRRVAAVRQRLGLQPPGPGGPRAVHDSRGEKPADSLGRSGRYAWSGFSEPIPHARVNRPATFSRANSDSTRTTRTKLGKPRVFRVRVMESNPDHPDRNHPAGPRWPDLDTLREAYGEARGVEAKRAMVAEWAAAAGGKVEDGILLLPAGVSKGAALEIATLKTYARCVGLTVGELPCVWCPNPPL